MTFNYEDIDKAVRIVESFSKKLNVPTPGLKLMPDGDPLTAYAHVKGDVVFVPEHTITALAERSNEQAYLAARFELTQAFIPLTSPNMNRRQVLATGLGMLGAALGGVGTEYGIRTWLTPLAPEPKLEDASVSSKSETIHGLTFGGIVAGGAVGSYTASRLMKPRATAVSPADKMTIDLMGGKKRAIEGMFAYLEQVIPSDKRYETLLEEQAKKFVGDEFIEIRERGLQKKAAKSYVDQAISMNTALTIAAYPGLSPEQAKRLGMETFYQTLIGKEFTGQSYVGAFLNACDMGRASPSTKTR